MAPGFHLSHPSKKSSAVVKAGATPTKFLTAEDAAKDAKKHEHRQHLAQTCAVAAGAFALHEHKAAKKHPQHEEKHKKKEKVAVAIAVGAGVIAAHEKHEKKNALKQAKLLSRHRHRV
eukprot:c29650_g1_i1 orf=120-473(-)